MNFDAHLYCSLSIVTFRSRSGPAVGVTVDATYNPQGFYNIMQIITISDLGKYLIIEFSINMKITYYSWNDILYIYILIEENIYRRI